jgi:preprotein translocase subunit SecG
MIQKFIEPIWAIVAIGLNFLILIQNPKKSNIKSLAKQQQQTTWLLVFAFFTLTVLTTRS